MNRRCFITLLDNTVETSATGFQKHNKTEGREVTAQIVSVRRTEFYAAAAAGMKPAAVFIVSEADYCDEVFLIHEEKRYRVIRTYRLSGRKIELTCEGDAPNGT